MQKPLSFDRLQQDMPTTLARIIARARDSKSRRFDASTDPATWAWSVDWAERDPVAVDGEDPKDADRRWDDLRTDSADSYVRERIRRKAMLPSLRLKTGPTAIVEPLLPEGELPSEWVETFGLKTYEPLVWNGATITLYQPNHRERPGLADAAVFAGYATASGATVVLLAEGHQDREYNTLWSVELNDACKTATVTGMVPRLDGDWDVPVGTTLTVNDEKWRRLDHLEVERTIKAGPWGRIDARSAREAQVLLGLAALGAPSRPTVSVDPSTIPDGTPYWPVGAARSDADLLQDKWAPPAPSTAPVATATTTATAEGNAPAAPTGTPAERKKPTTVAGSVKANDPEALRAALAASASGEGLQLSTEQLSALLLTASAKAGPDILAILIENGANPAYRARDGMSLAGMALRSENIANLKWLNEQKLFDLEEDDGNGNTLFMLTVESGLFTASQALLDMGANINGANLFNHTALHQAAQRGNGEVVKWLIEHKADPNHENYQNTIAEEMVPNELPEMVDALANYRFAYDKGESYELPADFLASLRNESKHPDMQPQGGDATGMEGLGGLVQISGLEGVTRISGDDFARALGEHGVDGLVAAGQNGTLGQLLGVEGAGGGTPEEQMLRALMRDAAAAHGNGHDQDPAGPHEGTTVNPADFLFAHVGYGRIVGVAAHLVAITPKALWDAEGRMDDQPHWELLQVLPKEWQPDDLNEGGSWALVTTDSPEQVTDRLRALGFGEDRVFSAMVRATEEAPEPLDGDEPDEPAADTPPPRRPPRMR